MARGLCRVIVIGSAVSVADATRCNCKYFDIARRISIILFCDFYTLIKSEFLNQISAISTFEKVFYHVEVSFHSRYTTSIGFNQQNECQWWRRLYFFGRWRNFRQLLSAL